MNLRQNAMRGGVFLLARQLSGFLGSAVLLVFVMRIIGPAQYGVYAASAGVIGFLSVFSVLGADVYLLREGIPPTDDDLHCASTLLLYVAFIVGAFVFVGAGVIGRLVGIPQTVPVTRALALCIPLYALECPPKAKLSRELNFKQIAVNDLMAQTIQCAVALPLAFRGAGVWAPVAGVLSMYATGLVSNYVGARFLPRYKWDSKSVKSILSYGFSFSTASWARQARSLVNPVVVGHFGGPILVGYVSAAIRIAAGLGFASDAILRVAAPTLSHVKSNVVAFKKGVREAMKVQALAVGLPLGLFTLFIPMAIHLVMGQKWASVAIVFPFVALSSFVFAIFQIETLTLHILNANFRVTIFYCVQFALLAAAASFCVRRFGLIGYGFAELAALPSYFLIHSFFHQLTAENDNRLSTGMDVPNGIVHES
jgi:O-antigen/teichoic acid export membrane protein